MVETDRVGYVCERFDPGITELTYTMIEPPPGRRAANKADKLRRISAAARGLFTEKGYDGTTMRDIAAVGGVGFGTIFDYASSKRDLLFLILNPQLIATLDEAYAAALQTTGYVNRVMRVFEGFYRLYESEPQLSRYLLRELNFYKEGAEAEKFMAQRSDFLSSLARLTVDAQNSGELHPDLPPQAVAQILLSVFAWEVRRWIATDPLDMTAGMISLRRLVEIQTRGFERPTA